MKAIPPDIVKWMADNCRKSAAKSNGLLVAVSTSPLTDAFIGDQDGIYMTEGEIAMCDFARNLEATLSAKLARLDWRPVAAGLPTEADADEFGDVEWSDGKSIWQGNYAKSKHAATHWRPIHLPTA